MNIQQAIDTALRESKLERSPNTARSYSNGLKAFGAYLASEKIPTTANLDTLKVDHFIYFPAYLLEQGHKKKTVYVYLAGANYLLDWLIIKDYIQPTYQEGVRYKKARTQALKQRGTSLPRHPKDGAAEALVQAAGMLNQKSPWLERNMALIAFLYSSGCRNAEVVNLKVKDVDLSERSAAVVGKGDKPRRVFFDRRTKELLEAYWKARGHANLNDPVFSRHDRDAQKNHKVETITTGTVRNVVATVRKMAGVEQGAFTPHSFRHARATDMLRATHDLVIVQKLLGHKNPATTEIYTRVDDEELRDAYQQIYG